MLTQALPPRCDISPDTYCMSCTGLKAVGESDMAFKENIPASVVMICNHENHYRLFTVAWLKTCTQPKGHKAMT